jgi:hypothetical protein
MPTPFTHLAFAERLRSDRQIPASLRALIESQWPAFLLGSIAADGHFLAGAQREDTHFYAYDRPMEDHPWRVMVTCHPSLLAPRDQTQQSFAAGYTGHVSMDEIWSLDMLNPHFAQREWAPRPQRFLMLNILLIAMDERDLKMLPRGMADDLQRAEPQNWLPFLSDSALKGWGDLIYRQIRPGGSSETLEIISGRVGKTPEELRALLDSPEQLQDDLWAHIPPPLLADIEERMYAHAVEQIEAYLGEVGA